MVGEGEGLAVVGEGKGLALFLCCRVCRSPPQCGRTPTRERTASTTPSRSLHTADRTSHGQASQAFACKPASCCGCRLSSMCQRRLKSVLAAVPRLGHELCSQLAQAQPHLSPVLQRLYVEVNPIVRASRRTPACTATTTPCRACFRFRGREV